jgi:hypothetical protein
VEQAGACRRSQTTPACLAPAPCSVFSVQPDVLIAEGAIGLNAIQRRVSTGTPCSCHLLLSGGPPPPLPLAACTDSACTLPPHCLAHFH